MTRRARNKTEGPHTKFACSGKELPIFVETACHDSVSGIERFLDAIPVMNVDVNVQHTVVIS